MDTIVTFEGRHLADMSRDELVSMVKAMADENERLRSDVIRYQRDQVETFRKIATLTGHRVV